MLLRSLCLVAACGLALGDSCACSGTTPCQYVGGTECFALKNAFGVLRCPKQTQHCSCACSGATPCEANGVCVATTTLYGKEVCPGVGVHCISHEPPPTTAPGATVKQDGGAAAPTAAQQCTCGGGTPCLINGKCVQMHATASGALACPVGATACDCDCNANDPEHPCKYVDASGASFCFAHTGATLAGVTQCPAHTIRCAATAMLPPNLAPATSPPNTEAVYHPTPAPNAETNDYGQKNCLYNGWGEWSECSRKCGGGVQRRTPIVTQPAEAGGAACPLDQTQACNEAACQPVDCAFTWSDWSSCSVSVTRDDQTIACGGGKQTRKPIITAQPKDYGAACPAEQARPCRDATGVPHPVSCYDPAELPRCKCDPFAIYGVEHYQKVDPNDPNSRDGHKLENTDATTCSVDTYGRVQVHHPQPKFLNNPAEGLFTRDNAGGKVVCQHKGSECKCCACHHLQCGSNWGAWSTCAMRDGNTVPTQVRKRTMPGSTLVGNSCAKATESRRCQDESLWK